MGSGSVSVTAGNGCTWTATSNANWITINSGSSGSGNGVVGYSVQANPSTGSRSGTLTVAGETFTVYQAGVTLNVALTSPDDGATISGTVQISANANASAGVSHVEFYRDNNLKIGEDTTAPYTVAFDTLQQSDGQSVFHARVIDTAGNAKVSAAHTVTVANNDTGWVLAMGGSGIETAHAISSDADNNIIIAGYFNGTMDFGGGALTSAGNADIFVAKYSPAGDHLWSKRFGSAAADTAHAVHADAAGNIYVAGRFDGTTNLGGGDLASAGSYDIFLAKYSPNGDHLWSKRFGDTGGGDWAQALAVDRSGNVLMAGSFTGHVNFGGGDLSGGDNPSVFIAKYTPGGSHMWSRGVHCSITGSALGLGIDGSDNPVMVGRFGSTIDFGGSVLTSAGLSDVYVAKYSAAGEYLWAKRFGGSGDDWGYAVAVSSNGQIVVTGGFVGAVSFGGGTLVSAGRSDIFVAQYSAAGEHQWSRRFGGTSNDDGYGVALDSNGNVVVTGHFHETIDCGGGPITSIGIDDIFLAKYSSTGGHLWSAGYGGAVSDKGFAVTVDGSDYVLATGFITGTAIFEGEYINGGGSGTADVFLLKSQP